MEGRELVFYMLWSEGGLTQKILLYKDLREETWKRKEPGN